VNVVNIEKKNQLMSGFNLDDIGDLSSLLSQPETNGPLNIPLDLIDEDPNQPRHADNPGFSKASLGELAATISLRGVKSPISVRENQDASGRYIINHGARRYRASRIAGKDIIPAFVDNDYNSADQVIENLQRNELTPREIADFVGRELAKGKKKSQIATELGKSPAFITQHVTLLDLPDPIADAFNSGRCRDVTVINELVTAHKKNPSDVGIWLDDETQEVTRGTVKLLREFLDDKLKYKRDFNTENFTTSKTETGDEQSSGGRKRTIEADPNKLKKAVVMVEYGGRRARLILTRRPPSDGYAWLKYEDDGHEFEADLAQAKLISLLEG
jgi:ParB family transcriptional regulator, chromosome partitioning protein